MNILDASLEKIREGLYNLTGERRSLMAELSKWLDRRSDLLTLPLPREDFIDKICEAMDSGAGNEYPASLKRKHNPETDKPMNSFAHPKYSTIDYWFGTDSKIDQSAILWCMRDQLKAGVRAAVETWDWPSECGPSRAERKKELASLDKRIATLQEKVEQIKALTESEGVSLRGVGMGNSSDQSLLKRSGKMFKRLSQ